MRKKILLASALDSPSSRASSVCMWSIFATVFISWKLTVGAIIIVTVFAAWDIFSQYVIFTDEGIVYHNKSEKQTILWSDIKCAGLKTFKSTSHVGSIFSVYLSAANGVQEKLDKKFSLNNIYEYNRKYGIVAVKFNRTTSNIVKKYYQGEPGGDIYEQRLFLCAFPDILIERKVNRKHIEVKIHGPWEGGYCILGQLGYIDSQGVFRKVFKDVVQFIPWEEVRNIYYVYSEMFEDTKRSVIISKRDIEKEELEILRHVTLDAEHIIMPDIFKVQQAIEKYRPVKNAEKL